MIALNLDGYVVSQDISVLEALRKINFNTKGFVLVVNEKGTLVGTLTDGDVRRRLINGDSLDVRVSDACNGKFTYLNESDGISAAIDLFKDQRFKFLPIVDADGVLVNIITKQQLHSILLQDIQADLTYDFSVLDENIVDHEIFQRPWGFYKTTVMNEYFQSKVICVKPGAQLSLQSHNHREEHWIVAHGMGKVQIDKSFIEIKCGSSLFIPMGAKHRLINTGTEDNLIVTEVQIGDYFGEDDIIRYEDVYGRA